jgi:Asp-tRNA(Asn)/Glu-tRNA(Gln) amidotransferase B subunit
LTLYLLGAADILRGVIGSIMKAIEGNAYAAQVKNLVQEHLARS